MIEVLIPSTSAREIRRGPILFGVSQLTAIRVPMARQAA